MKQLKIVFLLASIFVFGRVFSEENSVENNQSTVQESDTTKKSEYPSDGKDPQDSNSEDIFDNKKVLQNSSSNDNNQKKSDPLEVLIGNADLDKVMRIIEEVLRIHGKQAYKDLNELLQKHPEIFMRSLLDENKKLTGMIGYFEAENSDLKANIGNLNTILSQSEKFSFQNMLMHVYKVHPTKTMIVSACFGIALVSTIFCTAKSLMNRFNKGSQRQKKGVGQQREDISYLLNY